MLMALDGERAPIAGKSEANTSGCKQSLHVMFRVCEREGWGGGLKGVAGPAILRSFAPPPPRDAMNRPVLPGDHPVDTPDRQRARGHPLRSALLVTLLGAALLAAGLIHQHRRSAPPSPPSPSGEVGAPRPGCQRGAVSDWVSKLYEEAFPKN